VLNVKAIKFGWACIVLILACSFVFAQKRKTNISLRDSLDGAFDLSDYIIDANGFVPVPYIITEPALGGFGGALVPVFIKKRPPYVDSVKGKAVYTPIPPDITGGALAYTVNGTWLAFGFRSGTLVKSRIKYMIGGGYADVNMSFYRTFNNLGEKELKFNFKAAPIMLQATKRIGLSRWYAGFRFVFLNAEAKYVGDTLLENIAKTFESEKTISTLGGIVEYDNRDNIFTPDRGMKLHIDGNRADDFLGSDFEYWRINYYTYLYRPLSKRLIGGLRLDGQQVFGDVPFYLLPYMNMRGLPACRYQGNASILSEGELRWDFVRRWSIMAYAGTGKAFDEWSDFKSAEWITSYGTGFRYLLARKFRLRVGIDIAKGPENWAYYIVFGSNWLK
jgi:hypothetical protein